LLWSYKQIMITNKLKTIKDNYFEKSIELVDGLHYNQADTLKKIEYYWNSRYMNGQRDELGRIKPFYNISKFRVNVATRATDLDVKDVRITSDNPDDRVRSMILNHELKNWFKRNQFSKLLNDFGKNRAKYGGALIKKIKKDKDIKIELVEWKNVICNPSDIEDFIVEVHYMSPSDLLKKKDVWDNIDEAIEKSKKKNKKNSENKIEVYEMHGEFAESLFEEGGDENTYKRMMFILTDDFILFKEEEKESPYKYLAWDNVAGRVLGVGIVEDGFEAQMWTNDAIIAEKNVMDLAGKVFIKTNSRTLGNNIISDMENGQVISLQEGEDANIMNLVPSSLPQFQNLVEKWNQQYERATNTFDAVSGETMPSGTPLGSLAIQSAQSSSFFDYRREEAGIFWSKVLTEWVLPDLIKSINQEHILNSDYSFEELKLIDERFSIYNANQRAKEEILSGKILSNENYEQFIEEYLAFISQTGNERYIKVPKDYFKDFNKNITIDITGESRNKQTMLQSLDNVLAKISANPTLLQDPNAIQILNEMLELTGVKFFPKPVAPQQMESKRTPETKESSLQKQTEAVLPEAQR
jgi:hypothetical protein